jgi:integrase/recombinase XerC
LDLDQAQALLIHGPGEAQTNPDHDRDAIALGLMEVLGLRAGEIVAPEADHFTRATSTASGSLQVYGKGRTWRTVPLPPWLEQLITAYRTRLGTNAPAPLLLSPTGTRLAVRDLERLLARAVKRTRVADPARARAVVPHGLRHTAATLMLAEGWDVKVVARLLVRATLTTTSKYLDELPGKLSVAINAPLHSGPDLTSLSCGWTGDHHSAIWPQFSSSAHPGCSNPGPRCDGRIQRSVADGCRHSACGPPSVPESVIRSPLISSSA